MPKRKHKKYSRPKKLYDIQLLKEENGLIKKYGLKNRREIWKANYAIEKLRNIAKKLITAEESKREEFVNHQKEKGFPVENLADILGLNKEDYLKRRLQSVLFSRGLCTTYKQARQLITHKHVLLNSKAINSPAHLTTLEEEKTLQVNIALPLKKEISEEEKTFLKNLKKKTGENPEEVADEGK